MKLSSALILAVATLAAPAVLSAAVFEGKVRMKMTDGRGKAQEMDYHVKEGLVRINMQLGENVSPGIIMNSAKQEMIILMPEQKMYMTHSLADVKSAAERASGQDVTFEKTSETAKILGYDCVKYVSKSKDGVSDVWATDELGQFMGLGGGAMGGGRQSKQASGWEKALMGKNFFPLKVITKSNKGREEFRMEAVAVEKGAQPASLFVAPADYQKFDLGGMMQGLGLPRAKR